MLVEMRPFSESWRSRCRAFTLIELLVVMTVIMVLLAIGIGVLPSLFEGQKAKKAVADIAVIQTALEKYKSQFGTYPKRLDANTDMGKHLFNSLNGKVSGKGDPTQVKPMLNLSVLDTANSNMPNFNDSAQSSWVDNRIVDPWGNEYVYRFDPEREKFGSWKNFTYALFSMGPDGAYDDVSAEGVYNPNSDNNADNVHAE